MTPALTWATIAVMAGLAYYAARGMGAAADVIDDAIGRAAEWLGYDVRPDTED